MATAVLRLALVSLPRSDLVDSHLSACAMRENSTDIITDYTDAQFSNVKLLREAPILVSGPDGGEADPELGLLKSLYEESAARVAQ